MHPSAEPHTPKSVPAADLPAQASAVPTPTISELLTQSRAAHYRKKQSAGRADRHGQVSSQPNYITAEHCLAEALLARLTAETLDPDHGDEAWITDQAENKGQSSDALIAFFITYLSTDRYSSAWDDVQAALDPKATKRLNVLLRKEIA